MFSIARPFGQMDAIKSVSVERGEGEGDERAPFPLLSRFRKGFGTSTERPTDLAPKTRKVFDVDVGVGGHVIVGLLYWWRNNKQQTPQVTRVLRPLCDRHLSGAISTSLEMCDSIFPSSSHPRCRATEIKAEETELYKDEIYSLYVIW